MVQSSILQLEVYGVKSSHMQMFVFPTCNQSHIRRASIVCALRIPCNNLSWASLPMDGLDKDLGL